jgi:hypothetical protein
MRTEQIILELAGGEETTRIVGRVRRQSKY